MKLLIFDTGPLRELFTYSAVHDLGFHRLSDELQHLRSESEYHRLSSFIGRFGERTTTAHVVAEISRWIRDTEKTERNRSGAKRRPSVWGIVFSGFRSMGISEELIRLLDMPANFVEAEGAVDGSILALASREAPRGPLVLSFDSALIAECRRRGLSAIHLWEVVAADQI